MTDTMAKPKFTPGPWKALPNSIGTSFYINCAGEGGEIDQYSPTVAETWGATYSPDKDASGGRNDAHLIAAAPDMYAMLEQFLPEIAYDEDGNEFYFGGSFNWNEHDDPMIAELIALLAKARGEQE